MWRRRILWATGTARNTGDGGSRLSRFRIYGIDCIIDAISPLLFVNSDRNQLYILVKQAHPPSLPFHWHFLKFKTGLFRQLCISRRKQDEELPIL
jgi:hypothetical protein